MTPARSSSFARSSKRPWRPSRSRDRDCPVRKVQVPPVARRCRAASRSRRSGTRRGWPWPRSIERGLLLRADRPAPSSSGCGTGSRDGGFAGLGTSPSSTIRLPLAALPRVRRPAPPTAAPACTDASGARRSSCVGPISTILPRYITATRSEMWRTTDRSCAMNRYARPKLVLQVLEQVHDPAWIDTSSADTGSSSTSSSGSSASARAMPMRCRCPPENSCG